VAKRISTLLADEVLLLAEREREMATADAEKVTPIDLADVDLVAMTNKSSNASVSSLVSSSSSSSADSKGDGTRTPPSYVSSPTASSSLQLSLLSPAKLQASQKSPKSSKSPRTPSGQNQVPSRAQRIKFEQNELGFFSSFVRPYFAALADHIPSLGPDLLARIDRNISALSASIEAASLPVTPSSIVRA
jgi:hypothetical protein